MPFKDMLRLSLDREHPADFLGLVSVMVQTLTPDRYASFRRSQPEPMTNLAGFTDRCIAVRDPEHTALLTVLAAMVDDPSIEQRCREELARRHDTLPRWMSDLTSVEGLRAVRLEHVLGDRDQVMIGMRVAGEFDLTCVVMFDHYRFDDIVDAVVLPFPLDRIRHRDVDDFTTHNMTLADARAWIAQGLASDIWRAGPEPANWPGSRPLLGWLTQHLPDGGTAYEKPDWDQDDDGEMFEAFFATPAGRGFDRRHLRALLSEVCENTGTGDPLLWSEARIAQLACETFCHPYDASVAAILRLPDLLRVFVPFAHARRGIRDELTADALAAVERLRSAA